jgi:hypothetical protein
MGRDAIPMVLIAPARSSDLVDPTGNPHRVNAKSEEQTQRTRVLVESPSRVIGRRSFVAAGPHAQVRGAMGVNVTVGPVVWVRQGDGGWMLMITRLGRPTAASAGRITRLSTNTVPADWVGIDVRV